MTLTLDTLLDNKVFSQTVLWSTAVTQRTASTTKAAALFFYFLLLSLAFYLYYYFFLFPSFLIPLFPLMCRNEHFNSERNLFVLSSPSVYFGMASRCKALTVTNGRVHSAYYIPHQSDQYQHISIAIKDDLNIIDKMLLLIQFSLALFGFRKQKLATGRERECQN